MVSSQSFLLTAAAIASTASAANRQHVPTLNPVAFVQNAEASRFSGDKVKLDFYTHPAADPELKKLNEVKSVVMRLHEHLDFNPHQFVVRGEQQPLPGCRNQDGSGKPNMSDECKTNCQNQGRYCDVRFGTPDAIRGPMIHGPTGDLMVQESARRMCIWYMYGMGEETKHPDLSQYFKYYDAMLSTGCDKTLGTACIEQALQTAQMDQQEINQCMGNLNPELNEANGLLEGEIYGDARHLPALFVDDEEKIDFEENKAEQTGGVHGSVLEHFCKSIGNSHQHPDICGMCLSWCPRFAEEDFDMKTCLWELKCGGGSSGDYTEFKANAEPNMQEYYSMYNIEIHSTASASHPDPSNLNPATAGEQAEHTPAPHHPDPSNLNPATAGQQAEHTPAPGSEENHHHDSTYMNPVTAGAGQSTAHPTSHQDPSELNPVTASAGAEESPVHTPHGTHHQDPAPATAGSGHQESTAHPDLSNMNPVAAGADADEEESTGTHNHMGDLNPAAAGSGTPAHGSSHSSSHTSSHSSSHASGSNGVHPHMGDLNPGAMASSQQDATDGDDDGEEIFTVGHIVAITLLILAIGATGMFIRAVRVWRTKRIIDRYMKAQRAMMNEDNNLNACRRDSDSFSSAGSAPPLDMFNNSDHEPYRDYTPSAKHSTLAAKTAALHQLT